MKEKWPGMLLGLALLVSQGCGGVTPLVAEKPPVPLAKANPEAVFRENEGLAVVWEDAKDARDFYRGGVQQKARAEMKSREKAPAEALKLYQSSNDFFTRLLQFIPEDTAEYPLYEGTQIVFMPTLLMADNYLQMGKIQRDMGREGPAQSNWKNAQGSLKKSLQAERTEWGLSLEKELALLSKGN